MITLLDGDDFGVVIGIDWYRWYVGVSLEQQLPDIRAGVFRLGPFFMHVISRDRS